MVIGGFNTIMGDKIVKNEIFSNMHECAVTIMRLTALELTDDKYRDVADRILETTNSLRHLILEAEKIK